MTNYNKRVFEMLVRVLVFRSTIQDLIGKDSHVNEGFDKVEAALKKIEEQSTLQTSGQNNLRMSSEERTAARESLRQQLEGLTRTAASMGLKQFFMPRDRGDRAIANVARIFVQLAEPLKDEFLKHHVPEGFIERLKGGIASIDRAIQQQARGKSGRGTATVAIAAAREEALAELTRLDPLIENLLYGNPPMTAAWYTARRVASPRRPGEKQEPGTPATPLVA